MPGRRVAGLWYLTFNPSSICSVVSGSNLDYAINQTKNDGDDDVDEGMEADRDWGMWGAGERVITVKKRFLDFWGILDPRSRISQKTPSGGSSLQ
jgi:hypothetical protein